MKKSVSIIFLAIVSFICLTCFVACNGGGGNAYVPGFSGGRPPQKNSESLSGSEKDGASEKFSGDEKDSGKESGHIHEFVKMNADKEYLCSEATCVKPAWYYFSCECGEKGDEIFEYGENAPHEYAEIISDEYVVEKICGANVVYHVSCVNCGEVGEDIFEGDLYPHEYAEVRKSEYIVEKTCGKNVVYRVSCVNCGEVGEETFEGEFYPHDFSVKDPTANNLCSEKNCQSPASYYYLCSICGKKGDDTYFDGEKGDHVFNVKSTESEYLGTKATCTAKAKYYYSCVCGEKGTETFESGYQLPHDYINVKSDEYLATAGTCVKKAVYYKSCSSCGREGGNTFEGEYGEHNYAKEDIPSSENLYKEKDCVSPASFYYVCTECGGKSDKTYSYGVVGSHRYDIKSTEAEYLKSEATCTQAATYYYSCKCGKKGISTFTYGNTVPHTFDQKRTTNSYRYTVATCERPATYFYSCVCGKKGTETFESGGLAAHKYIEKIDEKYLAKAAACDSYPEYYRSCSVCGEKNSTTFTDYEADLPPHVFDREVATDEYIARAATCSYKAAYYRSCVCGARNSEIFEYGDSLPHTIEKIPAVAATCETDGYTEGEYCTVCHATLKNTETVAATGHNYIDDVCVKCQKSIYVGLDHFTFSLSYDGSYRVSGNKAYENSDWGKIRVPETYNGKPVGYVGDFSFCKGLVGVIIPDSVKNVSRNAFPLDNEIICEKENGLYYVDGWLIGRDEGDLESLTVKDGCRGVGCEVFSGMKTLRTITLSDSVTILSDKAFYDCDWLKEINIGKGLRYVGDSCFSFGWTRKRYLDVNVPDLETWCSIEFGNSAGIMGAFRDYSTLMVGGEVLEKVVVPDFVTEIKSQTFAYNRNLTEIVIGDNVTKIDSGAFSGCSALKKVTIGSGVKEIGKRAFYNVNIDVLNITDIDAWCGIEFPLDVEYMPSEYVYYSSNPITQAKEVYINGEKVTDIVIGEGVTEIKYIAFYGLKGIENIVLPSSLTKIGDEAFRKCEATTINIPENVTEIGEYAFASCANLKEIVIPDGVTRIEKYLFRDSGLERITLPDSVESIGKYAFSGCYSLNYLLIGKGLKKIETNAFDSCNALEILDISDTDAWCLVDMEFVDYGSGILPHANPMMYADEIYSNGEKLTEWIVPEGITEIKDYLFYGISGVESIILPNSVKTIGNYSFRYGSMKSVQMTENITDFGVYSFADCNELTAVVIPSGMAVLQEAAFYYCKKLESVVLPQGMTEIGDFAFSRCQSLSDINFPEGLTRIGRYAFNDSCKFTSLVIPDSVSEIGEYAFYDCSITELTLPKGITEIGEQSFAECRWEKLNFPSSLKKVGKDALWSPDALEVWYDGDILSWLEIEFVSEESSPLHSQKSSLKFYIERTPVEDLVIPSAASEVKQYAFSGYASLKTLTIEDGVTSIAIGAFASCKNLTEIRIPKSVTYIADDAFSGCSKLSHVTIDADNERYCDAGNNVIDKQEKRLMVASLDFVIPSDGSVTIIGESTFGGYSLDTIVIPDCIEEIESNVFRYSQMKTVTFGSGLKTIGDGAFCSCNSVTEVVFPEGLESIGAYVFGMSSGLERVYIGKSTNYISPDAFRGSNSLKEIVVSEENERYEFKDGCLIDKQTKTLVSGIKGFVIPTDGSVTKIGENAFYNFYFTEALVIPDCITEIGESAFGATHFEVGEIYIPESVIKIGKYGFDVRNGTIYAEAKSRPEGWNRDWCGYSTTVVWGYEKTDS